MTEEEYVVFEGVFREVARPLLEAVRLALVAQGHDDLEAIAVVDHDESRGLGFQSASEPELYVALMLADGGEYGFEGVALIMRASDLPAGVVWAPGNYTPGVGLMSPGAVADRLAELDVSEAAQRVAAAWAITAEQLVAREPERVVGRAQ